MATIAALVAMIGTHATPAHAATAGTATLVLAVSTSSGLGDPVLFSPAAGPLTINSPVCIDSVAGKATTAGFCVVWGGGTFWGNCGWGAGSMWGEVRLSNGTGMPFHVRFDLVAYDFFATGTVTWTNQTGTIVIEGTMSPVASLALTQSCLTGTQREFMLVGSASWATT